MNSKQSNYIEMALIALSTIALTALVVGALYSVTGQPEMGITQDGKCKWVEMAPDFERRECPDVLPERYNRILVDGGKL